MIKVRAGPGRLADYIHGETLALLFSESALFQTPFPSLSRDGRCYRMSPPIR